MKNCGCASILEAEAHLQLAGAQNTNVAHQALDVTLRDRFEEAFIFDKGFFYFLSS